MFKWNKCQTLVQIRNDEMNRMIQGTQLAQSQQRRSKQKDLPVSFDNSRPIYSPKTKLQNTLTSMQIVRTLKYLVFTREYHQNQSFFDVNEVKQSFILSEQWKNQDAEILFSAIEELFLIDSKQQPKLQNFPVSHADIEKHYLFLSLLEESGITLYDFEELSNNMKLDLANIVKIPFIASDDTKRKIFSYLNDTEEEKEEEKFNYASINMEEIFFG